MVDAAISIPIYIIAVVLLLTYIKGAGWEENAYYEAETRIQTVGAFGSNIELGTAVDNPGKRIYIDHVQYYPIIKITKINLIGTLAMDMPYRTFIGESPDKYEDTSNVYVFPKNEGKEKYDARYHTEYCPSVKASLTKGYEMKKMSKSEAQSKGYTKCMRCKDESH